MNAAARSTKPIGVLVVDDSALMREILSSMLTLEGDIDVLGAAADAHAARQMIRTLGPDVVTLDIEMPDLNGLAFLERLMRLRPTPVVMVSTLTTHGAGETLLALELGAVDFVAKPGSDLAGDLNQWGAELRQKVRAAAVCKVRGRTTNGTAAVTSAAGPDGAIIAIGASTGGVEAVRVVLEALPTDSPPVLVVQHMPAGFTERFAARLDSVSKLSVCEAADGLPLQTGRAYIARGDRHLRVQRTSDGLVCRLGDDAVMSGHRPSVDALFASVAGVAGALAIGVILTGMGRDGTTGLQRIRQSGGRTIGQSEASSLVYGMPRAAFEADAVMEQVALEAVAGRVAAALLLMRHAA